MANIFIRTIILYILLFALLRLSGKREVGQLELTELVVTFMISELASIPITNNNIPLLYGIIPAITLICLEIFVSFASVKSKTLSRLLSGTPSVLVDKGKLNQREMFASRLTVSELMSALRVMGVSSLSDVQYAILEPSGDLSVITKSQSSPPSAKDMNIKVKESGIQHTLISDGVVSKKQLKDCSKQEKWLTDYLKKQGINSPKDVFFMGLDDDGEITLILKETK